MRSVKGEITVFLSLSFTLLLSFIFGILESAVIQGSKNLSRIDTDRAIYSVFGEYHQELMEQYHVLGTRVDLSGKKIEVEVFASKGRMKIHLIQRATKVKPEEKVRWKK